MRLLLIAAAVLPLGACHASWEKDGKVHRVEVRKLVSDGVPA